MKIDKDKFNKLSQLDRIEFRQRKREIDERYNKGFSITIQSLWLLLLYFTIIIISKTYVAVMGLSVVINFTPWISIIIPLSLLLDIIINDSNIRKTNELISEYFKVEVKKK